MFTFFCLSNLFCYLFSPKRFKMNLATSNCDNVAPSMKIGEIPAIFKTSKSKNESVVTLKHQLLFSLRAAQNSFTINLLQSVDIMRKLLSLQHTWKFLWARQTHFSQAVFQLRGRSHHEAQKKYNPQEKPRFSYFQGCITTHWQTELCVLLLLLLSFRQNFITLVLTNKTAIKCKKSNIYNVSLAFT